MSTLPEKVIRVLAPFGALSSLLRNRDKVAAGSAGKLAANDLTVVTGRGICRQWTLVAGLPIDHGEVADEAAMLALHVDSAETPTPRWVVPGDSCIRADDPGWRWHCIAGHGQALSDWERRPLTATISELGDDIAALEVELDTIIGSAALDGYYTSNEVDALLTAKAPLASPAFTGRPTCPAPTVATGVANKSYVDSVAGGGSTSPTAWVAVDAVEVSSAVASVELPSSGAMDADYEYKVELFGWSLAAAANVSMQVDLGSGYITSSSYARALSYIAAGENSPTDATSASSTVMLLSTGNADYPISGDIVFSPGHQSTGYSEVRNEFLYRNASGRTVHFIGRNWLTTPINAAIQRIRLRCSTQNTIAGMFVLLRRPLVA